MAPQDEDHLRSWNSMANKAAGTTLSSATSRPPAQ